MGETLPCGPCNRDPRDRSRIADPGLARSVPPPRQHPAIPTSSRSEQRLHIAFSTVMRAGDLKTLPPSTSTPGMGLERLASIPITSRCPLTTPTCFLRSSSEVDESQPGPPGRGGGCATTAAGALDNDHTTTCLSASSTSHPHAHIRDHRRRDAQHRVSRLLLRLILRRAVATAPDLGLEAVSSPVLGRSSRLSNFGNSFPEPA